MRIPGKSITDSTVIAISRSAAKRSAVPRQSDQAIRCPAVREGGTLLGGLGVSQVFVLAHRFSAQGKLVGVVHQPIEDGVGKRRIADGGVPLLDRDLAGDDSGAALISIINDFEQIAAVGVGHGRHGQIVEDQDLDLGQCLQELRIAPVGAPEVKLGEQPGYTRT